jgi:4'-phosphopantetheinyl transferase
MEVTVWWAEPGYATAEHQQLFDGVEWGRWTALRQRADRDRFTVAAALLRLVVAARTGLAPAAVPVRRECPRCGRPHGRPRIEGYDLHVSVTHSGERVAVAVSSAPVGVDVEHVRPINLDDLAPHTLAPDEQADGLDGFFRYWTRKESAVKATGDGLTVPLAQVRVAGPAEPARLLAYPGRPGLVATMSDLDAGEGYAAAVTVLAAGPVEVTEHDAAELLGHCRTLAGRPCAELRGGGRNAGA